MSLGCAILCRIMNYLAKSLIFFGVALAAAGVLIMFAGKIPGVGKLPGDIYIRKENFSFYFPLTTCLLVGPVLTLLFSLFGKK